MARPKTANKPSARTKLPTKPLGAPVRKAGWPEVLTLTEAAAYLRVPEAEVVRLVGPRGLPGRLIGSDWRFSKTALDQWLRTPPGPSTKESLLALTGVWKDDPDVEDMLKEIYRPTRPTYDRGRSMILLDTDILTLWLVGHTLVSKRVLGSSEDVATTVVSRY